MAKCRIGTIAPPCGYNVEGIAKIWLLDFEDFDGFRFQTLTNYDSGYVSHVLRREDWVEIKAPDLVAKYTSTGAYVHVLESFVGTLSASTLSTLNLATKRRHVVLFKTNAGSYFIFGYEAGAKLTYTSQTAEALGSTFTLTAPSIYPLFETRAAILQSQGVRYEWVVDFDNAYCLEQI